MAIRKILLSLLLCTPLSFCIASTSSPGMQSLLQQDIAKYNIPGASLSIVSADGMVHTYNVGFADLQTQTPMATNTLFDIGSMTKMFTVVVVLEAVNQHKLTLDEPLNRIATQHPKSTLAQLVQHYPHLKNITVRELMNHTSGMANGLNSPVFSAAFAKDPTKNWQPQEVLDMALSQPPLFAPGAPGKFNYNNEEYVLLGYVSEAVNHQSMNDSLSALFKQLGLKHSHAPSATTPPFSNDILQQLTHVYFTPSQGGHSAGIIATYEKLPAVTLPGITPLTGYDLTTLLIDRIYADFPAGGVISNSADIAHWYQQLFAGQILPPQLVQQLLMTVPVNSAMIAEFLPGVPDDNGVIAPSYGLAVLKQYLPQYHLWVYYHGGREPGYLGINVYIPKYHIAFALLTNLENDYTVDPASALTNDIIHDIIKTQT